MSGTDDNPQVPDDLWIQFTPKLKEGITREYKTLVEKKADASSKDTDKTFDWLKAFMQYTNNIERDQRRNSSWFHANVTGLMVITAVMALAFGAFGVWGLAFSGVSKEITASFLDIAKLFAGALVGAAGAAGAVRR